MSHREQALVDQMAAWRAQIDATPEQPWWVEAPDATPREQRLAEARERRAQRLAAPISTPAPTPADAPEPAALQKVRRYDTVITPEDAEFSAWKRSRRAFHAGRARGGRSRR